MKNKIYIRRILFLVAVAALLVSVAAMAGAEVVDPCPEGVQHAGPFSYRNRVNATCTENGHWDKYCDACGRFVATEPIIAQGHQFEESIKIITLPTCLTPGLNQVSLLCKVCGYNGGSADEIVNALGHDWGSWTVTVAATCTSKGTEARVCKRDSSHIETRDIDPLGHKWDAGKVTREPDCTNPGVRTYTCQNDPSHTRTESIPVVPDAHKWDSGKITKAPNCTEPGVKTYTCTINPDHTRTEAIAIVPDAHDWDNGKVIKPATCEEAGTKQYTCRINPAHVRTETIPALGHKWDKGTITKQPTLTEEGEKKYVCQNDSSHVRIEKLGVLSMNNNTVCAFGPRLRDVNLHPSNTDLWYMFTPFDASKDGVQTYELVASNMYIVGSLTLTIRDGNLTIDYKLADTNKFQITLEFFTVLNRIGDLPNYEPETLQYLRMTKNQPINLAETFGDDTSLVLYFCSRCNYTYSSRYTALNYNSATHQRMLSSMLALMD